MIAYDIFLYSIVLQFAIYMILLNENVDTLILKYLIIFYMCLSNNNAYENNNKSVYIF